MENISKDTGVLLTLRCKIQYNESCVNLEPKGHGQKISDRKGEQMDYIRKMLNRICKSKENPAASATEKNTINTTIRKIAGGGVAVIIAICCLTQADTSDMGSVGNTQSDHVEDSQSDDGSAPGRYLAVNNQLLVVQSDTFSVSVTEDTQKNKTNETESSEDEAETVQTQEVLEESETTSPAASAVGNESQMVSGSEYVVEFSDEDYEVLCTIVEAEAGDQDDIGRILVANVILNRVRASGDTITEVVFANNGRTYQFSPVRPGGSYYRTTASQRTIECVERALKGEDYSEGAMYFAMKTSDNSWFNTSLTFLFKHGDHYFYKK